MSNNIDIRIRGNNTSQARRELSQAVDRALEAIGIQFTSHAKAELQNNPVRIDTGLLRNSITHAISGGSAAVSSYRADTTSETGTYSGNAPNDSETNKAVYIGTNVNYAIYVHEGTRMMSPNHFLRNAVQKHKNEIKQISNQYLQGGN